MSLKTGIDITKPLENTRINRDFLSVNCTNISTLRTTKQFQRSAGERNIWHRFKVPDVHNYEDQYVLDVILKQVSPIRFLPVLYQKHAGSLYFLSTNCRIAIEKLCDTLLIIVDAINERTFKLEIDLGAYLPSDVGEYNTCVKRPVNRIIQKRICQRDRTEINLSSFHNEPELKRILYCPLSFPSNFYFVIQCFKLCSVKDVHYLDLSDNGITEISDLNDIKWYCELKSLDLRNNKISDINQLYRLRTFKYLNNIWLDGNPLCANFDSPKLYIKVLKEMVPRLKNLDGVDITQDFIHLERNYMIRTDKVYQNFVNHFLEHYFNLYDSENRYELSAMYHKDALFSMTTTLLNQESTSRTVRLFEYLEKSRNQLKMADYRRSAQSLYYGNECILEILRKLPKSQHDPYSFAVTVPIITKNTVVVSVLGVFRESEDDSVKSFTRVFVLSMYRTSECRITNEMLHISNATTKQALNSFKYERPPINVVPVSSKSKDDFSDEEKNELINILCLMTEMKTAWSQKCLTECNWEMKEALLSFTELYRNNKIPLEAFVNSQ